MKFCCYCCSVPKLYIALCKLHGLLHTRLLCPPLSPGVCLHSCPIESVMLYLICCPFSFCLQSFPASGSFPMCRLFASCGKSIGASAISFPMNIKRWCLLRLTGLVFLLSKGLSRVFTRTCWQVASSSFAFWKSFFFFFFNILNLRLTESADVVLVGTEGRLF